MCSPHPIRWWQSTAYCSSGLPGHSEASFTILIICKSSCALVIWWCRSFSTEHDSGTIFPSTYTDQLLSSCSITDLVAWMTLLGPFSILTYWASPCDILTSCHCGGSKILSRSYLRVTRFSLRIFSSVKIEPCSLCSFLVILGVITHVFWIKSMDNNINLTQ